MKVKKSAPKKREIKSLKDLAPQYANSNRHKPGGMKQLANSVQRDGLIDGITVAANGDTFSGSARIETLGDVMPGVRVVVVDTDAQTLVVNRRTDIPTGDDPRARRLGVAANSVARQNYDPDGAIIALLANEDEQVKRLIEGDADAVRAVVDASAGDDMADAEPLIDQAEELRKKWKTKTGQLWRMGEHRLLIGDCTVRENVERLMGGERAELIFTSPPYSDMRTYKGGDMSPEKISSFIPVWFPFCEYAAVNLGIQYRQSEINEYWKIYIERGRVAGKKLIAWNVWDKAQAGGVSNQSWLFALEHEFIFVFGNKNKPINRIFDKQPGSAKREMYYRVDAKGRMYTGRRQADSSIKNSTHGEIFSQKNFPSVIQCAPVMERGGLNSVHPATLPVELPLSYAASITGEGDIVSDPFVGSGTTFVACQNLHRRCFGMEISPAYCAVILERMSTAFPGLEIELIDDDQKEIHRARRVKA